MKYFVILLLVCVALATAAPQFITWPGIVAPGVVGPVGVAPLAPRTVVAGPTVVNGVVPGWPGVGHVIAPGVVSTII